MRRPNGITASIDMLGVGKTIVSIRIIRGMSRTDGMVGYYRVDVLDSYLFPMFKAAGISLTSTNIEYLMALELTGHEFIKQHYSYFTKLICDDKSAFDIGNEIGSYHDPYSQILKMANQKYDSKINNAQINVNVYTELAKQYPNSDYYKTMLATKKANLQSLITQKNDYTKSMQVYYEQWVQMKSDFSNYVQKSHITFI